MKKILPQKISSATLTTSFYIILLTFVIINSFAVFVSPFCLIDISEHIRASFFINIGLIPYKDFFEHHNPLLWYLLAPITSLMHNNVGIFPLAHSIALLFNLLNIYLLYKIIKNFLSTQVVAQLSVILLLSVPYIWKETIVLRPDIFMHTCFLSSILAFFNYLKKQNIFHLIVSYTLFSISFLFLQKILPFCLLFLIINLYFIYKNKISKQHFCIASVFALLPLAIFLSYLYLTDALSAWFYYNFKFNLYMKEYYNGYVSGVPKILVLLAVLIFFIILKKTQISNLYNIIYGFYLVSAITLFFWHPHIQYYVHYFIFSAPLIAKICEKTLKRTPFFIALLCSFVFSMYSIFPNAQSQKEYQNYMSLAKFIIQNATKQKSFLNLGKVSIDIFNKPSEYLWFGYHNVAIIDILTHPTHTLNLNKVLKETKPEYLYYKEEFIPQLTDMLTLKNSIPFMKRNMYIYQKAPRLPELLDNIIVINSDFHNIDTTWIKNNYKKTYLEGLWQKK